MRRGLYEEPFTSLETVTQKRILESQITYMAGQGAITRAIAKRLIENGWTVVYVCVPNTPHIGVVSIPTAHATSKQRYPDILAYKDDWIKLVEVEINLTENVYRDITTRFHEMLAALSNLDIWVIWRDRILRDTGHSLPITFKAECDLILCSTISANASALVQALQADSISVATAESYSP